MVIVGLPGLDSTDKMIVSMLSENPDISQSEMAKSLKISQPAVGMRIRELKNEGIITHFVGVNLKKADLNLAKVDITCSDTENMLKFFEKCPRCLNALVTSGRFNLCLLFLSEDLTSLHACIDQHIRQHENVSEIEFNLVIASMNDLIVPLKITKEKEETTPCKKLCNQCAYYLSSRCQGCPSTTFYKGRILG